MKPEEKVVSETTAERLKAAGFPQYAERFFVFDGIEFRLYGLSTAVKYRAKMEGAEDFAAPDAQELSAVIPFRNKRMGTVNDARLSMVKLPEDKWACAFFDEDTHEDKTPRFVGSMQESVAELWLYLKENNLI